MGRWLLGLVGGVLTLGGLAFFTTPASDCNKPTLTRKAGGFLFAS